ncbi:MAG: hydrogenase expression/formation protein [Rubrimonas sp.]|uniref:hydrogenase expression/formation protein n=1 Tax=Rubrimonas sp. TaxID=2036015 RepID=UPI002FDC7F6E
MSFTLPPMGFGPGSQPAPEDGELSYMAMPSGMRTYEAHLPEIDDPKRAAPALAFLLRLSEACESAASGGGGAVLPLDGLDPFNRALVEETLGEGEVALTLRAVRAAPETLAQEAVFAGVWRVRSGDAHSVEIGAIPQALRARAHEAAAPPPGLSARAGEGVMSAPALVAELLDKAAGAAPGAPAHVVNLTLLPHTVQDLAHLDAALGHGAATLLSRGYGNCRLDATATRGVWRVRFFNSMDALILDTIEAVEVPEVALAAPEDLADSAERLREVHATLAGAAA